ncbi:proton-conducting transporter membrane subunit [Cryobacterium serini]|uniref:proton-conducting transporter transmembrane domain-containing protein n=1 Tax=Cryobacterium serini TaxID=1259201 RepID=UPI002101E1BC|nr:proton-conducting transporter membrane subunit [Cryobacterium serini]
MNVALDTLALLPEGFVLGGAIVALLAGSFLPRNRQVATRWIAILALLASVVAAAAGMTQPSTTVFEASFAVDVGSGFGFGFGFGFGRIIIALATIFVIVLGIEELSGARRESETYALLLLAALGAMLLSGASDLLILVTGYLLTSIPLYALIGMSRSTSAVEAAMKTYLLGALLGIMMMLGITMLFGVGGGTSYRQLGPALVDAPPPPWPPGLSGCSAD